MLEIRPSARAASSRSREGAWIEISQLEYPSGGNMGRSREGAWIEMALAICSISGLSVAPVRERGLKYCLLLT